MRELPNKIGSHVRRHRARWFGVPLPTPNSCTVVRSQRKNSHPKFELKPGGTCAHGDEMGRKVRFQQMVFQEVTKPEEAVLASLFYDVIGTFQQPSMMPIGRGYF